MSPRAVKQCRALFADDASKTFELLQASSGERADLTLSLDVIYHLVEDHVFRAHMAQLFDSADRYVAVYSSNEEDQGETPPHVRHRRFTDWVKAERTEWTLLQYLPNRYPFEADTRTGSHADFFFYTRVA